MACASCADRREWIKKWSKVAYERAQRILSPGTDQPRADEADSRSGAGVPVVNEAASPRADEDQRTAGDTDPGAE
ncbi:hypothetical protein CP336_18805 [Pseudomonas fluorescens]|nr:hypothetical protein CP336_18805 [Pseudomonas fluorescens]